MREKYKSVGLTAHPTKGSTDSTVGEFWGAHLDGISGLVRPNPRRVIPIVIVTYRIASLGVCTIALLEALTGCYCAISGFWRRLMSLIEGVYGILSNMDRRDIIRLPPSICDELWSWALLSPLAVGDLRAQPHPYLYMTDASDWGEAAVCSRLPEPLAHEFLRHSVIKPTWTRLLSPFKVYLKERGKLPPELELPDGSCFKDHPLWETAARCLSYSVCRAKHARRPRHINIGEVRAAFIAEEAVGCEGGDARVLIGIDSQVAIGVLCKGRSASPSLNAELRSSLARYP